MKSFSVKGVFYLLHHILTNSFTIAHKTNNNPLVVPLHIIAVHFKTEGGSYAKEQKNKYFEHVMVELSKNK